jgi:hypothetical protein
VVPLKGRPPHDGEGHRAIRSGCENARAPSAYMWFARAG